MSQCRVLAKYLPGAGGGEKAYLAELDSLLLEQWDEG